MKPDQFTYYILAFVYNFYSVCLSFLGSTICQCHQYSQTSQSKWHQQHLFIGTLGRARFRLERCSPWYYFTHLQPVFALWMLDCSYEGSKLNAWHQNVHHYPKDHQCWNSICSMADRYGFHFFAFCIKQKELVFFANKKKRNIFQHLYSFLLI